MLIKYNLHLFVWVAILLTLDKSSSVGQAWSKKNGGDDDDHSLFLR